MREFVVKNQKKLALGYTTGSCAAAAAKAAAQALLSGESVDSVRLMTPAGILLHVDVEHMERAPDRVRCAVRKDAGDDPDITHGMLVFAEVEKTASGISIDGGEGVGRVTKPGLACAVGQAAINPGPREQITRALTETAERYGYTGGFSVVISAPEGVRLAERTFNPSLGIVGGLSILGTTGIVEPMSERALIDTIRLELDARYAEGVRELLICPGNYGEEFAAEQLGLSLERGVKCSNFIGETLDYAVYRGFSSVLLIGHAGKLIKLGAGVFQTHSSYADGRQEVLASHAAMAGADRDTVRAVMQSVSVDECIRLIREAGVLEETLRTISQKIARHLHHRTVDKTGRDFCMEYLIFTNVHGVLIQSDGAAELINRLKEREL